MWNNSLRELWNIAPSSQCEMKFAHIRVSEYFTFAKQIFHSAAISLARRANFVEKSTHLSGRQMCAFFWSGLRGSNPPPRPWQGRALPNELNPHYGASGRNRTNDTRIFSPLLYQLSYRGEKEIGSEKPKTFWRPGWDSNPRPLAWQASVLTNWTTEPHYPNGWWEL